jgi:hypothetical protein
MKVFVVANVHGDIMSVMVPDAAFADRLGLEAPPGGRVHLLDVEMPREQLLDPPTRAAREKTYKTLGALIGKRRPRTKRR